MNEDDFSFGAEDNKPRKPIGHWLALAIVAIVFALAIALLPGALAHADTMLATSDISDSTVPYSDIEALEAEYEKAEAEVEKAHKEAKKVRADVDAISAELAVQKKRGEESAKRLYLLKSQGFEFFDLLLGAKSLKDFEKMSTYLNAITKHDTEQVAKTNALRTEFVEKQRELASVQTRAQEHLDEASAALNEARESRASKQRFGIASALAQDPGAGAADDGADWFATEEEFVAEWAPRIDAYLAGSPMQGLGECFAKTSWRYCVDPRWSPAIANSESSKGQICIRPYNAWGWGAADENPYGLALEWGSWEEAIDAHIRGLSYGYGYTISLGNAKTYCTDWKIWYPNTLREMSLI